MSGYFESEVKLIPSNEINQTVTKDGVTDSLPEDGYYIVTTKDGTFKVAEGSNFIMRSNQSSDDMPVSESEDLSSKGWFEQNVVYISIGVVLFVLLIVFVLALSFGQKPLDVGKNRAFKL
jgi:maltodextrin utilization protein YvdJ